MFSIENEFNEIESLCKRIVFSVNFKCILTKV